MVVVVAGKEDSYTNSNSFKVVFRNKSDVAYNCEYYPPELYAAEGYTCNRNIMKKKKKKKKEPRGSTNRQ